MLVIPSSVTTPMIPNDHKIHLGDRSQTVWHISKFQSHGRRQISWQGCSGVFVTPVDLVMQNLGVKDPKPKGDFCVVINM